MILPQKYKTERTNDTLTVRSGMPVWLTWIVIGVATALAVQMAVHVVRWFVLLSHTHTIPHSHHTDDTILQLCTLSLLCFPPLSCVFDARNDRVRIQMVRSHPLSAVTCARVIISDSRESWVSGIVFERLVLETVSGQNIFSRLSVRFTDSKDKSLTEAAHAINAFLAERRGAEPGGSARDTGAPAPA